MQPTDACRCEPAACRCEPDPCRCEHDPCRCEPAACRCEHDPRRCEPCCLSVRQDPCRCEPAACRCEHDPRRCERDPRRCERDPRRCERDPRRCTDNDFDRTDKAKPVHTDIRRQFAPTWRSGLALTSRSGFAPARGEVAPTCRSGFAPTIAREIARHRASSRIRASLPCVTSCCESARWRAAASPSPAAA
jgi:hypothetical protein